MACWWRPTRTALARVLANLLDNAVRYASPRVAVVVGPEADGAC